MKMIVAILRPEQLPSVKRALHDAQFHHFTVATCLGTAPKSEQRRFRGVNREVSLFQRLRLEAFVNDSRVEAAVQALRTGASEAGGWGRILVLPLEDAVTVWTGERGPNTL